MFGREKRGPWPREAPTPSAGDVRRAASACSRSARAPVAALPAAPHRDLRAQAHRVGIRIDARALGAAALLRRARTPALDRWEAVEVGGGAR
jgi:hypothetical protein